MSSARGVRVESPPARSAKHRRGRESWRGRILVAVCVLLVHKVIGLQYLVTGFRFLLFGFGVMMLMRWQLAYPSRPIPFVGDLLGAAHWCICGSLVMLASFFQPGRSLLVRLTSKDVIHSFSLPEMRVKQDAIAGMEIPVWFVPDRIGDYESSCSQ